MKIKLTNTLINDILLSDSKEADFLCQLTGLLVGEGNLTVSLLSAERSPFYLEEIMKKCQCGCGKVTKKENNYINGHNTRVEIGSKCNYEGYFLIKIKMMHNFI